LKKRPGILEFLKTPGCLSGSIYLVLLLLWIPVLLLLIIGSSDEYKGKSFLDLEMIGGLGLMIAGAALIISPLFFLLWQHRAYFNLRRYKANCRYTRMMISLGSLIPGFNIIIPFNGIREIRSFCRKFISDKEPGSINRTFDRISAVTILQVSVVLFSVNVLILFTPLYEEWKGFYGPIFVIVFFIYYIIGYPSVILTISGILRYFWKINNLSIIHGPLSHEHDSEDRSPEES